VPWRIEMSARCDKMPRSPAREALDEEAYEKLADEVDRHHYDEFRRFISKNMTGMSGKQLIDYSRALRHAEDQCYQALSELRLWTYSRTVSDKLHCGWKAGAYNHLVPSEHNNPRSPAR
jgi:hypothetical protein